MCIFDEDVHGALCKYSCNHRCKHAIITLICYQLLASYFYVLNFQDSSTSGYLLLVILLSAVLSGFIISLCELSKYSIERDSLCAKLEQSKQDEYVKIEELVKELAMHKHESDHLSTECKEDRKRCLRIEEELRKYVNDLTIRCYEERAKFDQCKEDKRELDHQYQKLQTEVNKLNMEIVPLSVNHVPHSMHYAMYAHKNGDNRKRREATV